MAETHYFFFFSSAGAAASSFLPFLMTSGSATVTAAAVSSSVSVVRIEITWEITESAGLISFIEPVSGIYPARTLCPMESSETSIENSSGISSGKHSISISRLMISCKPP